MTNEAVNAIDQVKVTEIEVGVGTVLGGRYELLTPIARGGMGHVWVARAKGGRGFKRLVAVKTMIASNYEETRLEEMLFQEAKFASMIQHPNVVGVEDFGEHEGVCYLAMELVRGETLLSLSRAAEGRGGLPLKITVNLIGQICRGLQAAHDLEGEDGQMLGLVHRDVTPGNVIVTYGGVAKLADFGIAKAEASSALTFAGEVKGKMAYLAPEQLLQKPIDRRVDIFAVGITLYLATTGVHPFRNSANGMGDVLARIISDKPPPKPTDIVESYPKALEKVVMKALEKRREDRYATAMDLLDGLMEAMPEAFEPGIEKEIQDYLEELLSERISETTAQIRMAEEMAEKSFPDISAVRPRASEEAKTEPPVNPMAEIRRMLFWVLGIVFIPVGILAAVAIYLRHPKVVEHTNTVYLPGETKTITVTESAATPAVEAPKETPAMPAHQVKAQGQRPPPRTEAHAEKEPPQEAPSTMTQTPEAPAQTTAPANNQRPQTMAAPQPQAQAPAKPAPARPVQPKSLSSAEGQRRLAVDPSSPPYRPAIPRAMEKLGPFTADVRMCVSPDGTPGSIVMSNVSPSSLSRSFQNALTQWRYRPLADGNTPTGFCYSFRYEIQ